jgi:hypothetical protein
MADAFKFDLTSNATEIVSKLERFPTDMAQAIGAAMRKENELTINAAIEKRMSGPRPAVLGRVSSELARSLHQSDVVIAGNTILSAIGSNKSYAGFHERGFQGYEYVDAYDRKQNVYAGGSKTYKQMDARGHIKTRTRKPKSVSGTVRVRAHRRKFNYAGRPYIWPTLQERAPNYSKSISEAIVQVWNGGAS